MGTAIRVLHVDPDSDFLSRSADVVESEETRIEVSIATSVERAHQTLDETSIDCIVAEYELDETNGIEFLESVRRRGSNVPFILFTAAGSEAVASDAISSGVTDYLQKRNGNEQFTILANRIVNSVEAHVAQKRVQRRELEYRRMVDAAPVPIAVVDSSGRICYANSSTGEVLGVDDTNTVIGTTALDYVHSDDRAASTERIEHVFSRNEPVREREYRVVDTDDEVHHVRGNIVPVTFDGEPAAQVVLVDVTERKRRAQRLQRYETAVEAGGDAIYALDTDGYIRMLNEMHVQLSGHSREKLLDAHVSAFLSDEAFERGTALIAELLESDDRWYDSYTFEYDHPDGDTRIYENTVSIITDSDEFEGTVGIIRDVTERKETERKLKRQNDRLEKFASVVSHDLRNPLNVAELRLDLAKEECDSEELETVEKAHDRMRTLVDHLLDLARQGETVSDPDVVAVDEVVTNCWQTTETGGASVDVETDANIRADERRLTGLFENLFRNAIEHSDSEDVTITVGELDDEPGFYVSDDGPGVPDEIRDRLFEYGASTTADGTGFGLAIVREIVDAHDWDIRATESDQGGARFEIVDVDVVE